MAAGDVKTIYGSSTALTVTNLHSLPSSSDWTAGWESPAIDNSSDGWDKIEVKGRITVASSGLSAGQIKIWTFARLHDTPLWPEVMDGTESTETVVAILRNGYARLIKSITTDTTASRNYDWGPYNLAQFFGDLQPAFCGLFIAHSTGANLAASGSGVWTQGQRQQIQSS